MARLVIATRDIPTPIPILATIGIPSEGEEMDVVGFVGLRVRPIGAVEVARIAGVITGTLASTSASELCHQMGTPSPQTGIFVDVLA